MAENRGSFQIGNNCWIRLFHWPEELRFAVRKAAMTSPITTASARLTNFRMMIHQAGHLSSPFDTLPTVSDYSCEALQRCY